MRNKSLRYMLLGIPRNLDELLDKAEAEKVKKIHLLVEYRHIYDNPEKNSPYTTRISFITRYFCDKKLRQVTQNIPVKDNYYRFIPVKAKAERIKEDIESRGFHVETMRGRKVRVNGRVYKEPLNC